MQIFSENIDECGVIAKIIHDEERGASATHVHRE